MSEHFTAFSFVDHITEFEPGRHARGRYAVPAGISAFPPCLVAEAIGQLAAWVAMANNDFRVRPVAALANETRFRADVAPGAMLELAVDIENCDEHAVAYSGRAHVGATTAIELIDCLGPMLPVEEFDSPTGLRGRFDFICGAGAEPGAFRGVAAPRITRSGGIAGVSGRATLRVPESAPFFGDHFPRRPVFPATLLLDAKIGFAMNIANEATHWPPGTKLAPSRMTHVKMRAFIPPGAELQVDAELARVDDSSAIIRLGTHMDGKSVATARLEVIAGPSPGKPVNGPGSAP